MIAAPVFQTTTLKNIQRKRVKTKTKSMRRKTKKSKKKSTK